jgi:hypothetical protein
MGYQWWRPWHDERNCGTLPLKIDFDPLMHMGVLTCVCGFTAHFTMEEAARGERWRSCEACGDPTFDGRCSTCRWLGRILGPVVGAQRNRRLL